MSASANDKEILFKRPLKIGQGKLPEIHLVEKRRVVVDLPLPKAAESRSLEGIYPKWPNFPKIVLWRPKGGKSGKPKQNNKLTAPYCLCLRITQPLLPAKCTLPRCGRTPRPASGAPLRTPHTPASAGVRLGVYLLQRSPTQRHSCCGAPLNPTTSRPASAAPPAEGEPETATLLHPGDCTGFLQAARSWLASPRSNDTPGAEGRGGPGWARGRGRARAGEIGRERGIEGGRKPGGGVGQLGGRPF